MFHQQDVFICFEKFTRRRIRSDASPFLVPFWLKKWYCKIIAK
jgi:hypothetical protein